MQNTSQNTQQGGAQLYRQQEQENARTQQRRREEQKEAPCKKEFSFSFQESEKDDKELRKPRSRAYMEIFAAIDMLSSTDEEIMEQLKEKMEEDTADEFANMTVEELMAEIKASFREEMESMQIQAKSILQGVLSQCFISGCDVHAITPEGDILAHFEENKELPPELQKGRIIYHRYPKCTCVEVYTDCCRVINEDGTVTKIPNNQI